MYGLTAAYANKSLSAGRVESQNF